MIFSLPAMVVAWVRYWYIRFRLASRYIRLSWFWWLHMISVLWNLKPRLDGQDIHGTYWMWYRANMFSIKYEFKELKRQRKELGDSYFDAVFQMLSALLLLHIPMMVLNAVAVFYFTFRIFAFRYGFLKRPHVRMKRDWHKRKRKE